MKPSSRAESPLRRLDLEALGSVGSVLPGVVGVGRLPYEDRSRSDGRTSGPGGRTLRPTPTDGRLQVDSGVGGAVEDRGVLFGPSRARPSFPGTRGEADGPDTPGPRHTVEVAYYSLFE